MQKDIIKKYAFIIFYVLGIITSFGITEYNQAKITRREVAMKRKELVSELYGHISYIRYCWTSCLVAENEQQYLLDTYRISRDTHTIHQWREIQKMRNEYLFLAVEARKKLIELCHNIKLYFPDKRGIYKIIESCNWHPMLEFPLYHELTTEAQSRFKNVKEYWSYLNDSTRIYIVNYFKPLYPLVDSLKKEIGDKKVISSH